MTQDHRVGEAAVDQAQRHAGIRRVAQSALPFDEQPLGRRRPGAFEDNLLRRPGDKVRHDGVDGYARPCDHHTDLSRRAERARPASEPCALVQLQSGNHLTGAAVRADGEHAPRLNAQRALGTDRKAVRRSPHVPYTRARGTGERSKLVVVSEEFVQAAHHV